MAVMFGFRPIVKFDFRPILRFLNGGSKRTTSLPSVSKALRQEVRSQQYYDDLAKVWNSKEGATYVSHKTGNIVHTAGFGNGNYTVGLYKPSIDMTPEQTVKHGKQFFKLADDGYYGLHQYDRYLTHGEQNVNYLSTWNAQRKFWSPKRGWEVRDGNTYVRFQTTWNDNAHRLFGKCVDG